MGIFSEYYSPAGTMIMCCENGALTGLCMESDFNADGLKKGKSEVFELCTIQLDEYFSGMRKVFSIPLDLRGTQFQKTVWSKLAEIPYGETRTYADIAADIGKPKAYRAVGNANNSNPVLVIIPCHRVIGRNGKLRGYSGGLELQKYLLELEGQF